MLPVMSPWTLDQHPLACSQCQSEKLPTSSCSVCELHKSLCMQLDECLQSCCRLLDKSVLVRKAAFQAINKALSILQENTNMLPSSHHIITTGLVVQLAHILSAATPSPLASEDMHQASDMIAYFVTSCSGRHIFGKCCYCCKQYGTYSLPILSYRTAYLA